MNIMSRRLLLLEDIKERWHTRFDSPSYDKFNTTIQYRCTLSRKFEYLLRLELIYFFPIYFDLDPIK